MSADEPYAIRRAKAAYHRCRNPGARFEAQFEGAAVQAITWEDGGNPTPGVMIAPDWLTVFRVITGRSWLTLRKDADHAEGRSSE